MYTFQQYDYNKLDNDGEWVLRDPSEVALAGSQFGNASSNSSSPTDQTNHIAHGVGTPVERRYPSPTIAFNAVTNPYWASRTQHHENAGAHGDGVASPLFRLSTADGTRHQEAGRVAYPARHGPVRQVVDEGPRVEMSPAVRRVRFGVVETRRREAPQSATTQHHPGLRTTGPSALGAPPPRRHGNVADWTMDQDQAFHPQVGNLQMDLRLQGPMMNRLQEPERSMSIETETKTTELYPCRIEGCTSDHLPFTKESQRNKHEKTHLGYGCGGCRHHKKFATREELEQHQALEHSTSSQVRAQCQFCPAKSYARGDGLRRHFESDHPVYFAQLLAANPRKRRASSARSSRTATNTAPGTPTHFEDHGLLSPPRTANAPRSARYQDYSPPLDSPMQTPDDLIQPPSE